MKKNIYFVQVSDIYGTDKKSIYIPYAVGCIQSYCLKNKTIQESYHFGKFIYMKEPVETVVARLDDPFMVLFSCSVWNIEYNKALARAIKKEFPSCLITFGGHNVSSDGTELRTFAFVDYVTHRFGEEPTEGLLVSLASGGDLKSVCNISFKDEDGNVVTTAYERQNSTEYPSPYLEGTFDEILKDDINFSALFESNRGCPNSCTFCDWSELGTKVRLFSMDRVKAEIRWFAEHKIEYVYCVDANFCLFDRDAEIANYVVECKEKYGYPQIFRVFFTKNRFDFVFDVSTKFFNSGLDKAKTISFQSMNEQVLKNIGRSNIPVEFFKKLMVKYKELNIDTTSELILGLPGETYESFCNGINSLIENGQHFAISIYPCELLPNSKMGQKEYKEKYKIKSTRVPFKLIHSVDNASAHKITEYSEYITSTYSMDEDQWVRAMIFSNFVQSLHNLGLIRAVAVYICNEYKTSYADFYNRLIEWSCKRQHSVLGNIYTNTRKLCSGIISGSNEMFATFEETGDILWGFDELIYLEAFSHILDFYKEVKEFVKCNFGDNKMIDSLFDYQYAIIKKIGQQNILIESDYDFYGYFNNIFSDNYRPLEKKKVRLSAYDNKSVFDLNEYAREVVWFGRNRKAADYTAGNYNLEYSEF